MADIGVGGGASKVLECGFWIVGDSVVVETSETAADL